MTDERRQQVQRAIGLGALFVFLWLSGLVGPLLFDQENLRPPRGAQRDHPAPILAGDVPPAPIVTVASGRHGGSKWSMVVSADRGLRCFGLRVENTRHRQE